MLGIEIIEWHNKRAIYKMTVAVQESLKVKTSSLVAKEIETVLESLAIDTETRARNYAQWEETIDNSAPIPKYPTGISFIDDSLKGGISAGQFILVMGDPEAGKTLISTQILRHTSKSFPVLFFCFEFTVRDFINQNREKNREIKKDNVYIINDGYSLSEVVREIKIWAKRGVRFVFIDSQMRVDNSERNGSTEQQESEKFSKLAKLCHNLEITIILIAQQGKEDTKGGVHTPMGSKKGGHEANQIWYIHKSKPNYNESGIDENKTAREFEISKNKQNGVHFKTKITLNLGSLEFVRHYETGNKPVMTQFKSPEITYKKTTQAVAVDELVFDMPEF